jgi:hypothetical protein
VRPALPLATGALPIVPPVQDSDRRLMPTAGWLAAALVMATSVPAAAARPAAQAAGWCSSIPRVEVPKEAWGFHAGQPYPGARSSYARGHGTINLSAQTATGVICQVDRVPGAPDRQIILSIGYHVMRTSHHAVMFGVEGNIMQIHVRVQSTTDARCAAGTRGNVTIFASYNDIKQDDVQFSFPAACRDHTRRYTGSSVVTNVPPN